VEQPTTEFIYQSHKKKLGPKKKRPPPSQGPGSKKLPLAKRRPRNLQVTAGFFWSISHHDHALGKRSAAFDLESKNLQNTEQNLTRRPSKNLQGGRAKIVRQPSKRKCSSSRWPSKNFKAAEQGFETRGRAKTSTAECGRAKTKKNVARDRPLLASWGQSCGF
jgi:hypothetical protein